MIGWTPACLSDLIDIKHGYAFQGQYFSDSPPGDVLLSPGNFAIGGGFQWKKTKYYSGPVPDEFVLSPGDLIVTMTDLSKQADTLGYAAIVPETKVRLLHNQRLGKVVLKSKRTAIPFLHWVMRSRPYRNEVLASCTGSTVKHTSPDKIKAYKFLLPSPPEQECIASLLDGLERKIELNRRMDETLESIARSVFVDWFVEYGPVRAKLEAESPYFKPELWDLFPSTLDDNGDPATWRRKQWQHLASLEYGKRLEGYQASSGSVPVYGTNGLIGWHDTPLYPSQGVIIGRKGAYRGVHFSDTPFFVIDTAFYLKPKVPFSARWAYYTICRYDINSMDSGSAIPSTSRDDFYRIEVVEPPEQLHLKFDEVLDPVWSKQRANRRETTRLIDMRNLLLPRLLSGEVRLKSAEKQVGEAL